MAQKLKFKPIVTRVRLNPEQAVLYCSCYSGGRGYDAGSTRRANSTCWRDTADVKARIGRYLTAANAANS